MKKKEFGVHPPGVGDRLIEVERHVGEQVHLVEHRVTRLRNILGYLSGLSSPSVTEKTTTFASSPRSQLAGTDQVAHVLDEQQAGSLEVQRAQRRLTWRASSGTRRRSLPPAPAGWCGGRAIGVVLRLDVAGDHRDVELLAQLSSVRSSSARLPRAGRRHEVERDHAARRSRSRTTAASSSFRAITRSRTSIVRTAIVYLEVGQPQRVARKPGDHRPRPREGRRDSSASRQNAGSRARAPPRRRLRGRR